MKIDTPILRRLGPVPFWRGSTKCLDELQRIYTRAALRADETRRAAHMRPESASMRSQSRL